MIELTRCDLPRVHQLWSESVGDLWPVSVSQLARHLFPSNSDCRTTNLAISGEGSSLLAFLSMQGLGDRAGIPLVVVHPNRRRLGFASRLLEAGVPRERAAGAREVQAGSGGPSYLWPGIPQDCPGALHFFLNRGFRPEGECHDLIQDVRRYEQRCSVPNGVAIGPVHKSEVVEVVAFEGRHFPEWRDHYASILAGKREGNVIVARCDGRIVGSVIYHTATGDHTWTELLGDTMGELGAVGVDVAYRRRGIGLAMVDFATIAMRQRGGDVSLVGWTSLTDWYSRLGYSLSRSYDMCALPLV